MIKQLRKKFVLITMSLITFVLLIVFAAITISGYRQLVRETKSALERNLTMKPDKPLLPQIGSGPDKDRQDEPAFKIIPVVTVTVDRTGQILSRTQENASISEDVLTEAIERALNDNSAEGTISGLGLRYMLKNEGSLTKIAFADRSIEFSSIRQTGLRLCFILIAALVIFYIICLFLARWAMRPVEKAWQRQQQFIADASHELKTPLTVILANLQILAAHRSETIGHQYQWLENTQAEAMHMKKLIEDLLFLAKSDAAGIGLSIEHFNLSETLWSCLLPFEPVAFERGVAVQEAIAPDIMIDGDAGQFSQLAAILLDNAIKYAGKGGEVTLRLFRQDNKIIFTVHNTGEPIEAEAIRHIFDRFYRTDKARSRSAGGYGLGLAIAKSIVEKHHGKIWAESRQKEGTTFIVEL